MRQAAVVAIALCLGLGTAAGAAEWTKVRIATEGAYPPWNATDSGGQLVGFELDLARDLCARMAVECEVVAQAWEGIIPALIAGRYDAIMASVDVDDDVAIPRSFALHANYPNPFNPDTRIAFSLDQPGSARLTVFNLLGQRIATLFDRTAPAGRHELLWDGTDERGQAVASGVYFYRLDVGDESRTRKMLLLR